MSPETGNAAKPIGVLITLKDIHNIVTEIDKKLDSEIRTLRDELAKLKAQLAAQWVVHGIMLSAIVFLLQEGISN